MTKAMGYVAILMLFTPVLQGCAGAFVAGAAGGAAVVEERRDTDTMIKDQAIEIEASNKLFGNVRVKDGTHINVTCINGNVLLTGEARTEELRQTALNLVKDVDGVRHIVDEIAVMAPTSLSSRSEDTWITTKVKAQLLNHYGFSGLRVKVITERRSVYLMGLVTREEAQRATDVAKQVSGVKAVVKVFEYLKPKTPQT
jgi:osmotically-inducible protein OsmY